MVKPYLSIKLKDSQHYYLEDETIPCIINMRLEKILKDAIVRVSFKGRSSSYSNGTRHHYATIFTTEKEISISEWNTVTHLRKMSEIEFSVEVPSGVTIPSHRKLEGSEGGKIEYMIEINLEAVGFLSKRSIQASHIIQVPLIAKININENNLEKPKESSIRWPKHEDNANACVLSAWIPHEGCIRGKDVPIRVEFKQPDRYPHAKKVFVQLVAQEFNASSKDILPNMTKQLDNKIVQKEENTVELYPEGGVGGRLLMTSQVVMFSIPANITPTINNKIAKVMKLDYKLHITVKVPKSPSDPSASISEYKDLSINLPVVIGTTGTIHDSGFDLNNDPFGVGKGREVGGNNSIHNGFGGRNGPTNTSFYSSAKGSITYGPAPQPISPIGFQMPQPNYAIDGGYFPSQQYSQQQMYPTMNNSNKIFVLNAMQLPYTTSTDSLDSNKIEGMPMPDFGNSDIYSPPSTSRQSNFLHDEMATLSSSPSASSTINQMLASVAYPPQQQQGVNSNFGYPPPLSKVKNDSATVSDQNDHHNEEGLVSNISASWKKMYNAPPTTKKTTLDESGEVAINSLLLSVDKPNTPTPPQKHIELGAQDEIFTQSRSAEKIATLPSLSFPSSYNSGVHDDVSMSPSFKRNVSVTRIDPLESVAAAFNNSSGDSVQKYI